MIKSDVFLYLVSMESCNFRVERELKTSLHSNEKAIKPGGSINWEEVSKTSDPSFRKLLPHSTHTKNTVSIYFGDF